MSQVQSEFLTLSGNPGLWIVPELLRIAAPHSEKKKKKEKKKEKKKKEELLYTCQ